MQDVFYIKASASNGIRIHHISLSAGGVTAPAEIRLRLKRLPATVTVGSRGTAPTIGKVDGGDAAVQSAVRANDTTQATTSGTAVILPTWQWQVLNQFDHLPAPEDRETCAVSEAMLLDIPGAPASTVISGFIKWEETP